MKATQFLLLGGLQVDEGTQSVTAADRIGAVWLVDERSALPLGGCVLFVELEAEADAPKEQLVRVSVEGPPGTLVLMNGEVPFAAPEHERRRATVVLDLDGVGIKQPGTYRFRAFAGNTECGSLEIVASVAQGRVRVRFGAPTSSSVPLTLYTEDGGFGGYLMAEVERKDGAVVLSLPAGFERLARADGFAAAAERAIDRAALGEAAGQVHEAVLQLP